MKILVDGVFMQELKGYQNSKTGQHVPQISVYSGDEAITITGLSGDGFEQYQHVNLECDLKVYNGSPFVKYIG